MASIEATANGIRSMQIRGATAIGLEAGRALARHVQDTPGDLDAIRAALDDGAKLLLATRPTAVTLANGVRHVREAVLAAGDADAARHDARAAAEALAKRIREGQKQQAAAGAALLDDGASVLTHCHATAVVGILKEAASRRKDLQVYATETRPFRQGLITAAAVAGAGIPVTFLVDSAAASLLASGNIDQVLVGADVVQADGSLYNKIGTLGVALAAKANDVAFHSAALTWKFQAPGGGTVEVEQRPAQEVLEGRAFPEGARVWNPVFDRTPPDLITGYVTEHGVQHPLSLEASR